MTCDDHGLDAHRFRAKRRWHLVTGMIESGGFY
jgi:hypothetical protein